jgi:multicomponent Na+:H+ antiporter subunit E
MSGARASRAERMLAAVLAALALVALYALWTGTKSTANLVVVSVTALIVSSIFTTASRFPRITPRRIAYGIAYIPYLFAAVVRANLDVARRIVRRRIPINPGIVMARTRLKSPMGRTVLANSITLTPGTLSVDIKGDRLFIHWIDVEGAEEAQATERIVSGFERYLEVIFG